MTFQLLVRMLPGLAMNGLVILVIQPYIDAIHKWLPIHYSFVLVPTKPTKPHCQVLN